MQPFALDKMLLPVVAFELWVIVGISDRFGAKKALFEIAMYHARRLRRLGASRNDPGARLLRSGGKKSDEPQKRIARPDDAIEPRHFEPHGREIFLLLIRRQNRDLALDLCRNNHGGGIFFRRRCYTARKFCLRWREDGIEHRFTKINHPWTIGQTERMNRTVKEAAVKRCHYENHNRLRQHLSDFIDAYKFGQRLKTLIGLSPYEFIC